jgi:hypothetical protein
MIGGTNTTIQLRNCDELMHSAARRCTLLNVYTLCTVNIGDVYAESSMCKHNTDREEADKRACPFPSDRSDDIGQLPNYYMSTFLLFPVRSS